MAISFMISKIKQLYIFAATFKFTTDALSVEKVTERAKWRSQRLYSCWLAIIRATGRSFLWTFGKPVGDALSTEDVLAGGRHQGILEDVRADGADELIRDACFEAIHVVTHGLVWLSS